MGGAALLRWVSLAAIGALERYPHYCHSTRKRESSLFIPRVSGTISFFDSFNFACHGEWPASGLWNGGFVECFRVLELPHRKKYECQ